MNLRIFTTILTLLIILFASGCKSPRKYYIKGSYDSAIRGAVKKLKKNKRNDKMIFILEKSYNLANLRDREQISYLNLEGNPDRWKQVLNLYNNLKNRQAMIRPVLPLRVSSGRVVDFSFVNYDEEIIRAKNNAADFYYTRGSLLLENATKESARRAYADFMNIRNFYNEYKDSEEKIQQALVIGTNYVIFKMTNSSGLPLPVAFEQELTALSMHDLNRRWLTYHTNEIKDAFYDYSIQLNILNILVSPESIKEIQYTETKEIQDGFQYVLDERGNVRKDSLGNDIKVPKMKIITCNLIETQQKKSARITGRIDVINNQTKQLVKSDPVISDFFFDHVSLVPVGDINALSDETRKKIGNKPMPFPSDPDIILQTGHILKGMTKNILLSNRGLFN
jgi:hypothetical protein